MTAMSVLVRLQFGVGVLAHGAMAKNNPDGCRLQ
jgi:hypothetical protein